MQDPTSIYKMHMPLYYEYLLIPNSPEAPPTKHLMDGTHLIKCHFSNLFVEHEQGCCGSTSARLISHNDARADKLVAAFPL